MNTTFKTYNEALHAAILASRERVAAGMPPEAAEYGLEYNKLFKTYNIIGLPTRANRFGHELRCEVVRHTDPLPAI